MIPDSAIGLTRTIGQKLCTIFSSFSVLFNANLGKILAESMRGLSYTCCHLFRLAEFSIRHAQKNKFAWQTRRKISNYWHFAQTCSCSLQRFCRRHPRYSGGMRGRRSPRRGEERAVPPDLILVMQVPS